MGTKAERRSLETWPQLWLWILTSFNDFEGRSLRSSFLMERKAERRILWCRITVSYTSERYSHSLLPVRKSKLSGWLRPSTMTCKVCTVVCNLSAVFSIPSFSKNESIFCCISGFPISYSVPPTNDKNLQRKKNKNPHHILIILLIFQSPYIDHSYSSQIHTSINWSLHKDELSWEKKGRGWFEVFELLSKEAPAQNQHQKRFTVQCSLDFSARYIF